MYGAAAVTSGCSAIAAAVSSQSGSPEPNALIVAWDVRLRMRVRSSRSKPFITDSTTISTATPIATPAMEMAEMKEMKRLLRFDRRYRRPMNSS